MDHHEERQRWLGLVIVVKRIGWWHHWWVRNSPEAITRSPWKVRAEGKHRDGGQAWAQARRAVCFVLTAPEKNRLSGRSEMNGDSFSDPREGEHRE